MKYTVNLIVLLTFLMGSLAQAVQPFDREGREFGAALTQKEITTPVAPQSGKRKIYPKTDGYYQMDSTGTETKVGSGGGAFNYMATNPDAEVALGGNFSNFSMWTDCISGTCGSSATDILDVSNSSQATIVREGAAFTYENITGGYPVPLFPNTVYYMIVAGSGQFKVAATRGGPPIDITSFAGGTTFKIHFVEPVVQPNSSITLSGESTLSRSNVPATNFPLAGSYSFVQNVPAGKVGSGWYSPFVLRTQDKGKPITLSYESQTGPGYVTGDVKWYLWDTTNGKVIYPTTTAGASVEAHGLPSKTQYATFNTSIDSVNYILVSMTSNPANTTSNVAYDTFSLAPATPTFSNLRVVGDVFDTRATTCPVGSEPTDGGTTTSGSLIAFLGTNVRPDYKGLFVRSVGTNGTFPSAVGGPLGVPQIDQMQGHGHPNLNGAGGSNVGGSAFAGSTAGSTGNATIDVGFGTPRTGTETRPAGVALTKCIQAEGSVLASSTTLGQETVLINNNAIPISSIVTGGDQVVRFPTASVDSSGSYDPSTGLFTVKEAGRLYVSTTVGIAGTYSTAGTNSYATIWKNGATAIPGVNMFGTAGAPFLLPTAMGLLDVKVGDTISIHAGTNAGAASYISSAFSIFKINTGGQSIYQDAPVRLSYNSAAGQAVAAGTFTLFAPANKIYDTTASYSGGTFTCPRAGLVRARAGIYTNAATLTAGAQLSLVLYKNGASVKQLGGLRLTANTQNQMPSGSGSWPCVSGDSFQIRIYSDNAINLAAGGDGNWLEFDLDAP